MTKSSASIALLILVTGCYGAEEFQEDSALTRCALYEECGFLSALGVEDYDQCLELLRSEDYACVEYEAQAAEACIPALEELTCEEYSEGYFPNSCLDACVIADD
jgi:hypothetical protein